MPITRRLVPILLGFLSLGLLLWAVLRTGLIRDPTSSARQLTWELIDQRIASEFPDVESLNITALEQRLTSEDSPPLLFDVRTPAEFDVSHLPGAHRVEPGTVPNLPEDLPRNTPIVTYCAVGYRSAALARQLEEQGFTHVHNLEGSIFAWANAGLPLESAGQAVHQVHPYDAFWGQLLRDEVRAPLP